MNPDETLPEIETAELHTIRIEPAMCKNRRPVCVVHCI